MNAFLPRTSSLSKLFPSALLLLLLVQLAPAVPRDLQGVAQFEDASLAITHDGDFLRATWKTSEDGECFCLFDLSGKQPLILVLTEDRRLVARQLRPVYRLAIGHRKKEAPDARYTFFDKVFA